MLVHTDHREIADTGAVFHRTVMRHQRFRVTVQTSRGMVTDFAVVDRISPFFQRARRAEAMVLLAGRGYFGDGGRPVSLAPGDFVISDQTRGEAEGYAGSPCEMLSLEWDPGELGPAVRGKPRWSRIGAADLARLRAHVRQADHEPSEVWVVRLLEMLRAAGLPLVRIDDPRALRDDPDQLVRVHGALDGALARLDLHPSLAEMAGALSLSERQAHRNLAALVRRYGITFGSSWRGLVSHARLEWLTQVLSVPALPLARVAQLTGYRSTEAVCHALALRGAPSPTALARQLKQRWA